MCAYYVQDTTVCETNSSFVQFWFVRQVKHIKSTNKVNSVEELQLFSGGEEALLPSMRRRMNVLQCN